MTQQQPENQVKDMEPTFRRLAVESKDFYSGIQ